jgi:spermidine/putrescine transport system ATP-binding protein
MIELVQLNGFEKRYPNQLSGGQQQRVAIARALINNPKVLLLDEPLGALDLKLRKQMQMELKRLQKSLGITFVYVTHDQEEALVMSDRIGIMNDGVLEQLGTPTEIYEEPATRFVASFIGETNLFDGKVEGMTNGKSKINLDYGSVEVVGKALKEEIVTISVRPERIRISESSVEGFTLCGTVKEHIYIGNINKVMIELDNGQDIKMERLSHVDIPQVGTKVYIYWKAEEAVLLQNDGKVMNPVVKQVITQSDIMLKEQVFSS